jgi:hypothetical protein
MGGNTTVIGIQVQDERRLRSDVELSTIMS